MSPFWVEKWLILSTLDPLQEFFKILPSERVNRKMKMITIIFQQNILFGANRSFWTQKMAHPHNSGSTLRIFLKFCTLKESNR